MVYCKDFIYLDFQGCSCGRIRLQSDKQTQRIVIRLIGQAEDQACFALRLSSDGRAGEPPIPTTIANTKRSVAGFPRPTPASAGPGQWPTSPQPMPKRTAPKTRGRSRCLLVGRLKFGAQNGDRPFFTHSHAVVLLAGPSGRPHLGDVSGPGSCTGQAGA